MMHNIGNVYCVGRNYRLHAEELGNAVPESPMFFMKSTHALAVMDGQPIELPGNEGTIHYEAEVVIRMAKPYREGAPVDELVDQFALGIDFTLRDVQDELKRKGHPWLKAKSFRHAAPITRFMPFPGVACAQEIPFALQINGKEAQRGTLRQTIFNLQEIVDFCGSRYGLGEGDLIFTGTPAGVGPVSDGDRYSLLWDGKELGNCTITLKR